jgi:hypothetical protein
MWTGNALEDRIIFFLSHCFACLLTHTLGTLSIHTISFRALYKGFVPKVLRLGPGGGK